MNKPIFTIHRYAGEYLFYEDRYLRPADMLSDTTSDKWRTVLYKIENDTLYTKYPHHGKESWTIRDGEFSRTTINAWKTYVIQSAILDDSDTKK